MDYKKAESYLLENGIDLYFFSDNIIERFGISEKALGVYSKTKSGIKDLTDSDAKSLKFADFEILYSKFSCAMLKLEERRREETKSIGFHNYYIGNLRKCVSGIKIFNITSMKKGECERLLTKVEILLSMVLAYNSRLEKMIFSEIMKEDNEE
jgi:hypothetical protein